MRAVARARFARYSPRKVNQVLEVIRGKSVPVALSALQWLNKGSVPLVEKTLRSAAANAGDPKRENMNLRVLEAHVGQGPVLKRVRAMAMGGRAIYKRKTCHLTVVVSDEGRN